MWEGQIVWTTARALDEYWLDHSIEDDRSRVDCGRVGQCTKRLCHNTSQTNSRLNAFEVSTSQAMNYDEVHLSAHVLRVPSVSGYAA